MASSQKTNYKAVVSTIADQFTTGKQKTVKLIFTVQLSSTFLNNILI